MNEEAFYLVCGLILFTGLITGFSLGFIRLGNLFLIFSVSAALSYVTYPYLSALFMRWGMAGEAAPVVAFFLIFLIIYFTAYFLFRRFVPVAEEKHRKLWNRFAGGVAGLLLTAVSLAVSLRFADGIEIPKSVIASLDRSGINDFIDEKLGLAKNDRSGDSTITMNQSNIAHGFVKLDFTTTTFTPRPDLEMQMLNLVNMERMKVGVKLLTMDTALTRIARAYSADMFTRGYFSHDSPEGVSPFQRMSKANIKYRYAGENLALAPTLARAHDGLMKSPGHRANILNKFYGKVGIGILEDPDHGLMITQEFKD